MGHPLLFTTAIFHAWGIEKEQLVKDALLNTSRIALYHSGMEALIAELSGSQPRITGEELMYILTNEEKYYGAAVILYPHVLNHIAKVLKKNFIYFQQCSRMYLSPRSGAVFPHRIKENGKRSKRQSGRGRGNSVL